MRNVDLFLTRLWAQESELVAAGLPAIPGTWWRKEIERFYRSGKRRWVIRKGRRVFASTAVAPRLAVAEMLFGQHEHIPGTPPLIYAFLSVQRKEATSRLAGIAAVLDALSVEYDLAGTTIRIRNRPAVFEIITASFRATVGGTVAFAWCDEVSSWNDDKLSKNPAEQVIGTLAPALGTLTNSKLVLVSSPLSTADFHAKQFDLGDTEHQAVSFGTTWDINPALTEERTHELEPNLREWTRQYAAEPQDGIEEDWFGIAVDRALQPLEPGSGIRPGMSPIFTIDPAFAHDYFGWSVVTSEPDSDDKMRRMTIVQDSGAMKPDGEPRKMLEWLRDHVVRPHMRAAENDNGTAYVHTDQAEFYSLRDIARHVGLTLLLVPWTGGSGETSKLTKFRAVRTAMLGGEVRIKNRPELVRQFRSVSGVLLPSGNERIEYARTGQGHCDELSAVVQGIAIALERAPVAAKPIVVVRERDNQDAWLAKAEREVNERRAREWKRSPQAVLRRAMR